MSSVKLKLKTSQTLKDGSHPIILQVLKDGKSISTLDMSCHMDEWDCKTNLPKNNRHALICEKNLLKMRELLIEGIDKGWKARKIVDIFEGKDTKELMFFKYHSEIDFEGRRVVSTIESDNRKLRKFKKFLNKEDIPFKDITFELLKKYKKMMENEGMKSTFSYLSALRQVYDYAIENDDYSAMKTPFKSSLFKSKDLSETENKNLRVHQVQEFFEFNHVKYNGRSFRNFAIDFWKFCFLMRGINFIEMAVMRPEDITGDYFEFTRQKLKSRVSVKQRIKIFPEAREIINKYLTADNEYVFPLLDNGFDIDKNKQHSKVYLQRLSCINYNLRVIGRQLGTDFNMTTTSARYSFVNIAKENNVPFLYLQELIGHKTKSTTDIYLDVFPQSKIDEYHRMVIDLILNPKKDKEVV
jgi:site-specific recombinase XerD